MPEIGEAEIVTVESHHSVAATIDRIRALLIAKGAKEFALIDHSGEAKHVGLEMPNTKVLIFGNPAAGTPLMLRSPEAALDLPLKLLVREDARGQVWISWAAPGSLLRRHSLPDQFAAVLGAAASIGSAAAAAEAAAP